MLSPPGGRRVRKAHTKPGPQASALVLQGCGPAKRRRPPGSESIRPSKDRWENSSRGDAPPPMGGA